MTSGKATLPFLIAVSRLLEILPGIMYSLLSNMFQMLAIGDFQLTKPPRSIISVRKLLERLGLFGILVTMRSTVPEMRPFSSFVIDLVVLPWTISCRIRCNTCVFDP